MIKNMIVSVISTLSLIFTMQVFADDTVPSNSLQMDVVIQKLNAKGYKVIREIEFKNGNYAVVTINADGNKEKLQFNAKSGDIVAAPKNNSPRISMADAVKKVNAAGYKNISKIKSDDNKYEVEALDKDGKQVDINVNSTTGAIDKEWF